MKQFRVLAFDAYVMSGPAYTTCSLDSLLSLSDQLSLEAVVDDVDADGRVFVSLEHSADGRNWALAGAGSEVVVDARTAATAWAFGSSPTDAVLADLVRLKVEVFTSSRAHVRVWVVGRGPRAENLRPSTRLLMGIRYLSNAAARLLGWMVHDGQVRLKEAS